MKASHFVRAFEKEVDCWERQLSLVLEVIEMILAVQRQWIYLEVCQELNVSPTHLLLAAKFCLLAVMNVNAAVFLRYGHLEHFSRERYPGAAPTGMQRV